MTKSAGDGSQPAKQTKKSKSSKEAMTITGLEPVAEEAQAAVPSTESETPESRQIESSMMAKLEAMIQSLQESNEQLRRDQLAAQEASAREISLLKRATKPGSCFQPFSIDTNRYRDACQIRAHPD
jgi:hypothetical protein